jgi:hypothetical protein
VSRVEPIPDPSGPGAPRFALTFFQARSMLAGSTICSIKSTETMSKAVFSMAADADWPRSEVPIAQGAPLSSLQGGLVEVDCVGRIEVMDGSSLSRIVRPFPFALVDARSVLRLLLTSARTSRVTPIAPPFRSSLTHGYAYRSPQIRTCCIPARVPHLPILHLPVRLRSHTSARLELSA